MIDEIDQILSKFHPGFKIIPSIQFSISNDLEACYNNCFEEKIECYFFVPFECVENCSVFTSQCEEDYGYCVCGCVSDNIGDFCEIL